MIVAAHQPNFMPWLGYFDKMRKADLFIVVDHVQMERQGFQNRTKIKTGEGPRWLTVPVVQASRDETIAEKRVDNSRDGRFRWGRKAMETLVHAYRGAPHFAAWEPALRSVFDAGWDRLAPLNEALIELCRDGLGIKTPLVRSSQLGTSGAKSEMVLNMCRAVGAEAYLAGSGASRGYLDVAAFERAGIRVLWQEFSHPRYVQRPPGAGFEERMTAFDLLFNCGPAAAEILAGAPAAAPAAEAAGARS